MEERARNYLAELGNTLRTAGDVATADLVDKALVDYNGRRWHEMTVSLLQAVGSPTVLEHAYEFNDNVLNTIRADISPVAYAKFIYAVCFSPKSTMRRALAVVESAQACFVGQEAAQGRYAAQCIRAMLLLQQGTASASNKGGNEEEGEAVITSSSARAGGGAWSEAENRESSSLAAVPGSGPHTARKILEEVEAYTRTLQMHEVEPVLLTMLHRARGRDYELRGQYTQYYINAFDVVTYAEKAEMVIGAAEMEELAFTTAVAALLSEEIFNFGKFLNFAAFTTALEESKNKRQWVLQWMAMCNEGSVGEFSDFYEKHLSSIQQQAVVLTTRKDELSKKVRLMALLHLIFYTPFNERTFDFGAIADRCKVQEKQVEPLLLAALAQGIVKGKIDGLEGKVHISWVEPRVLSLREVETLATHVSAWRQNVVGVTSYVSEQAKQITK